MVHTDGFIIKETPHQHQKTIWSALDESDFINRTNAAARLSDTTEFNMSTAEGCDNWLSHDLRGYARYSYADFLAGDVDLDCPELRKHALFLNWTEESA